MPVNVFFQSALLGFLYAGLGFVAWLLRVCGWRRDLVGEIERHVGPTHLRDLHAQATR